MGLTAFRVRPRHFVVCDQEGLLQSAHRLVDDARVDASDWMAAYEMLTKNSFNVGRTVAVTQTGPAAVTSVSPTILSGSQ